MPDTNALPDNPRDRGSAAIERVHAALSTISNPTPSVSRAIVLLEQYRERGSYCSDEITNALALSALTAASHALLDIHEQDAVALKEATGREVAAESENVMLRSDIASYSETLRRIPTLEAEIVKLNIEAGEFRAIIKSAAPTTVNAVVTLERDDEARRLRHAIRDMIVSYGPGVGTTVTANVIERLQRVLTIPVMSLRNDDATSSVAQELADMTNRWHNQKATISQMREREAELRHTVESMDKGQIEASRQLRQALELVDTFKKEDAAKMATISELFKARNLATDRIAVLDRTLAAVTSERDVLRGANVDVVKSREAAWTRVDELNDVIVKRDREVGNRGETLVMLQDQIRELEHAVVGLEQEKARNARLLFHTLEERNVARNLVYERDALIAEIRSARVKAETELGAARHRNLGLRNIINEARVLLDNTGTPAAALSVLQRATAT